MASLLIALLAVPAAAASQTRVVDDDGVQCPNAGYTSIQNAINASSAGDTVKVCAGNYEEQLTINKSIKVRAIKRWRAHIYAPEAGTINPTGSMFAGVAITADNAVFRGFRIHVDGGEGINTARPTSLACAHLDAAILVLAEGVKVRGNKIDAFGEPLFSPCGYDYGILVGHNPEPFGRPSGISAGVASVARVTFNWVTDFKVGGISVEHPDSYAFIRRNTVRFLHKYATTETCATACVTARPTGQAVTAFGIGVNVGARADIIRNAVYSGTNACVLQLDCPVGSTAAIDAGIAFAEVNTEEATVVVHNSVYRTQIGIAALNGSNGADISYNRVTNSGSAFLIGGDDHGIHHNRAKANYIGFYAMSEAEDNDFEDNNASGNTLWDCLDESDGPDTAGTDNFWSNNTGPNDDPDGICSDV